jgi:hypothetical protein
VIFQFVADFFSVGSICPDFLPCLGYSQRFLSTNMNPMKPHNIIQMIAFTAFSAISCKEPELHSPLITVFSPIKGQIIFSQDSIFVKARIEPKNTSVTLYQINIKSKGKSVVYVKNFGLECEKLSAVDVKEAFLYDPGKTRDLTLEIVAQLQNGEAIRETVPFKLMK